MREAQGVRLPYRGCASRERDEAALPDQNLDGVRLTNPMSGRMSSKSRRTPSPSLSCRHIHTHLNLETETVVLYEDRVPEQHGEQPARRPLAHAVLLRLMPLEQERILLRRL